MAQGAATPSASATSFRQKSSLFAALCLLQVGDYSLVFPLEESRKSKLPCQRCMVLKIILQPTNQWRHGTEFIKRDILRDVRLHFRVYFSSNLCVGVCWTKQVRQKGKFESTEIRFYCDSRGWEVGSRSGAGGGHLTKQSPCIQHVGALCPPNVHVTHVTPQNCNSLKSCLKGTYRTNFLNKRSSSKSNKILTHCMLCMSRGIERHHTSERKRHEH